MSDKKIKPLAVGAQETVFDEPWQAQVLAMADLLIQSGQLAATDWSSALGAQLKIKQQVAGGFNDAKENYYQAALLALTQLIESHQIISHQQLHSREVDWKNAYLSTPHGRPVELKND